MAGRSASWTVALAAGIAALAGCGPVTMKSSPAGTMAFTDAEHRAISQIKVSDGSAHGRVTPAYITCAEPSPDVAKAVSTAFNLGASGSATLPNGVTPEVALAVSRAHAEALVQLTERIATIQLLRDGLHRACEAYANGAITDTMYAVMLSRFDKTMVTMLASEMVAGAFGRTLAGAGVDAKGSAAAAVGDLVDKIGKEKDAAASVDAATRGEEDAKKGAQAATDPAAKTEADRKVAEAGKTKSAAQKRHQDALRAQAASAANVAQLIAAGGITPRTGADVTTSLAEIQRKYIENLNFDALEVACVAALDRGAVPAASPDGRGATAATPLAAYCLSSVLPAIEAQKGALLKAIVVRAETQRDAETERAATRASMKASLDEIREYIAAVKALLDQVRTLRAE